MQETCVDYLVWRRWWWSLSWYEPNAVGFETGRFLTEKRGYATEEGVTQRSISLSRRRGIEISATTPRSLFRRMGDDGRECMIRSEEPTISLPGIFICGTGRRGEAWDRTAIIISCAMARVIEGIQIQRQNNVQYRDIPEL